ncbi:cation:proton antiporter [Cellulomonas wangsupingiae]|uniref:Sodium:proton antiporter n=1 Tax=Cellulomonas wangsupingiae TaxID=2968085 RepID=A0ABY5K8Q6_9CELL|nr:sodium:proton antiporter [Cellulomonas wangsupingiae]MCC2336071.1 sodium:proton antiporter [Cellulomonas wangsupingiae]MCM0639619.1 sodium:proton antiporter [Cellulomonas wangsupingiae]UUI64793.1 sodium:proton antiporter [Cellulomonas wangsupingiae]
MDPLAFAVLAVLVIVGVTSFAPRVGVAAPLLLVLIGMGVSLLPFVPAIEIEPELILGVVLPPLLYSSARNIPTMDFRRDFRTISAFSVVLVVVSAVVVGFVLDRLVPGIDLATGIALGAIVSPTDAVATSVVRKAGVSPRIVTVLEGESMLNDASALVLLRSAIVATSGAVSLWGVAGDFVFAVVVAVVVGYVVGRLHVWARGHLAQTTSNVALSFVVPFVAYLPAEHLGASGLVAAVTAGLVTGHAAPRALRAGDRVAEHAVWRTIELLLEGAVFLLMGLEVFALVEDVERVHGSVSTAVVLGALTATLVLALRSAFVAWSVWELSRRSQRDPQVRDRLTDAQARLDAGEPVRAPGGRRGRTAVEGAEAVGRQVRRRIADIDYLTAERFGVREGVVLVWAGMRGVVTLAAAQSLPSDTPQRSLLVLVAFVVAAGTLLVQGATLPWLTHRLGLTGRTENDAAGLAALRGELRRAALARLQDPRLRQPDGSPFPPATVARARERLSAIETAVEADDDTQPADDAGFAVFLVMLQAQRDELLRLRDLGTYPSSTLRRALAELDAIQIGLELRR